MDRKNILYLDPIEVFCEGNICTGLNNDKIYFSDHGHLSKEGALLFIKIYEDKILNFISN